MHLLSTVRTIVEPSTHWLLNADGLIIPQLTSPFYLRRSYDLIAFLNQNVYKQKIDVVIGELLAIKSNLTQKMNNLDQYTNELTDKISCIPDYYLGEADILSTIVNPGYVSRIGKLTDKSIVANEDHSSLSISGRTSKQIEVPTCSEFYPMDVSVAAFDHLKGVHNRSKLKMAPEEVLMGLQNAPEAMECARRAVTLAPRESKDIALLSLGTILQRAQQLNDSLIVLHAAVDHEANEPENQLALGNTYMLLSEFNRSFEAYRVTESLSSIYSKQIDYIKKSITCFKVLKINLLTMEKLLKDIIPGLERYGTLQNEFDEYHEKLDREQAPLKSRVFDESYSNQIDFLIQRSQICTTRMAKDRGEPILSCDFISDVQMLMEDFAVEILNNYVDLKQELINTYKINSLGIYKNIFVEHL
ncbi:TRP-phosphatase [Anopheles sinensis]|uniref:TPR_REGION domain-containing protein n=1 Tax=Anopheles sinensis TaxID=74873 RepID=A0A084VV61_ANOSI|nr:TRP-phosphatase [Anopheles sinensis]